MSAQRHFLPSGSVPADQLEADITADIKAARGAQRDLASAGQHGMAERMGDAVDENLDELTAVKNGTWRPKHA
jgi:hypothetical protein